MWWWIIIEAVSWVIFGASESGTWKRSRFREHFGVEYDIVLGRGIEDYLRSIHDVPDSWTWHVSLESADHEARVIRVKYDDGYGQAGLVEIRLTGPSPSYQIIGPGRT